MYLYLMSVWRRYISKMLYELDCHKLTFSYTQCLTLHIRMRLKEKNVTSDVVIFLLNC